jgi:hypothetical protein
LPSALLGVSGTSASDVWAVGADRGRGPLVLRFDGTRWQPVATQHRGDLWWVHALRPDLAYFGGSEGAILRWRGGTFERAQTPALGKQTVFGVWARDEREVWAVGGALGRDGFLWRSRDGEAFEEVELDPSLVPLRADGERSALLKVWGTPSGEVFVVGDRGTLLHKPADQDRFERIVLATQERLFVVAGTSREVVVAGGTGNGQLLGTDALRGQPWAQLAPAGTPLLQGLALGEDGFGLAVGERATVVLRARQSGSPWQASQLPLPRPIESIHSAWYDGISTGFAVGGNVLSGRLNDGMLAVFSERAWPLVELPVPPPPDTSCPVSMQDPAPGGSIARKWNEQLLGAVRRDLPRPGVHARNLFHVSAALWDVWSAYHPSDKPYLVNESRVPALADAELPAALSFAAYGILKHRYGRAVGSAVSLACFAAQLQRLGFDPASSADQGNSAVAFGNRVAATYIASFAQDGANEQADYKDTTGYQSPNKPLRVDDTLVDVADLGAFQFLNLSLSVTQNGIPLPGGSQEYIGAQWGRVRPFALERGSGPLYVDPGPPPGAVSADLGRYALEVLERTSALDDDTLVDISPAGFGNNSLGADDGRGYAVNPIAGTPYVATRVPRGDFTRVLAEHWADGPQSETPPGHWNTIANRVADTPGFERRWMGGATGLDRLAWDIRMHFTLNGALHDAAIAAWEIKRYFAASRPITIIRGMGTRGQQSSPASPAYSPDGLPLAPGLVEVITEESIQQGRHAHLAPFKGQVAVYSWLGEPGNRVAQVGRHGWMRAVEWLPYQRRTFVTPAFPGFISGHSTFSRAAAEVLTQITGSAFFPGGFAEYRIPRDTGLTFERGPSVEVRLQWARYYDAADQAGQSRIYGGIHISPDDYAGRRVGDEVGRRAVAHAQTFIEARN